MGKIQLAEIVGAGIVTKLRQTSGGDAITESRRGLHFELDRERFELVHRPGRQTFLPPLDSWQQTCLCLTVRSEDRF
ncbi:MAG: hypothetical protein DWH91_19865 [Planctomycetota bacterium]|nr:MAG: hypothetical protein DWH91_19865 [Planctomycetota bacterium]